MRSKIQYFIFLAVAALFIGVFLSATDFIHSPLSDWKDGLILASQWLVVQLAVWTFVYLLSVNKYVFMIAYPLVSFAGAILAYFRYTMNAVLTTMIVDAALHNDAETSEDLFSIGLLVFVLLVLFLSIGIAWYRFEKVKLDKAWGHGLIALALFLIVMNIPRFQRPVSERIPFNMYFITERYLEEKKVVSHERPDLTGGIDCSQVPDSLTLVFVLGESLRADHLGINGYERNTTPCLSDEDLLSFTNLYCGQTYTNLSLPYIMTRADNQFPDRAYQEPSFVGLFKACGFSSSWLANQESAETYIYFMHECDRLEYVNIEKSPYTFDKWVDESLLPLLDAELNREEPRKLIILHTIGSHWFYNSHFTDEFEVFKPRAKSRILSSNSREEMINSYDNTVLCTDRFLHSVIDRLRDRNALLIYLSDHGESLGENNQWLHAVDSKPVHNPAGLVWMSPAYKESFPGKYEQAKAKEAESLDTDFLFHSILDGAGIQSPYVEPGKSIFK